MAEDSWLDIGRDSDNWSKGGFSDSFLDEAGKRGVSQADIQAMPHGGAGDLLYKDPTGKWGTAYAAGPSGGKGGDPGEFQAGDNWFRPADSYIKAAEAAHPKGDWFSNFADQGGMVALMAALAGGAAAMAGGGAAGAAGAGAGAGAEAGAAGAGAGAADFANAGFNMFDPSTYYGAGAGGGSLPPSSLGAGTTWAGDSFLNPNFNSFDPSTFHGGAGMEAGAPGASGSSPISGGAPGDTMGLPGQPTTQFNNPSFNPLDPSTYGGQGAPGVEGATPTATTAPSASNMPIGESGPGAPGGEAPGAPPKTPGLVDKVTEALKPTPQSVGSSVLQKLGILDDKGGIGKSVLPLAGLTLSQMNAMKNGNSLQAGITKAGQPLSDASRALLERGMSGQPNASTVHEIDQWLRNTSEQIAQRYASMGRDATKDSAAAKEMSDAKAKAVAMKDAAAQGILTQGLQAAGVAQGPAMQAAIAGAQQDKELSASMGNMLQALAMMQAMEGRKAP